MIKDIFKTILQSPLIRAMAAFAVVLVLASWMAGGCKPARVEGDRIVFSGMDIEGRPVSLASPPYFGKVLLVDIWGLWCPPCVGSVPGLIALQRRYQGEGFEVIGLEFAEGYETTREDYIQTLRDFAKDRGVNYTIVQAGIVGHVGDVLPNIKGFHGFPTTILIGRDGRVRQVDTGTFIGAAEEYAKIIEPLLRERIPQQ